MYTDWEETKEVQVSRIEYFKKKGHHQFSEDGRNAEITADLVLQAKAKLSDNKVNGPDRERDDQKVVLGKDLHYCELRLEREKELEKRKNLHFGGVDVPALTSDGYELTTKALGMAGGKESRVETMYSGKTNNVLGKLGYQDGPRWGETEARVPNFGPPL